MTWLPIKMAPDTFVGHSVERGGWCVYVQTDPGEYEVLRGPFGSKEEADASEQALVEQESDAGPAGTS